jgi:hypothetical protein
MQNADTFRKFAVALSNGEKPANGQCKAVDVAELWDLNSRAMRAVEWVKGFGLTAEVKGVGNIRENGFEFVCEKCTFKFNPPPAPGKRGVTQTSRIAYANLDAPKQAMEVAEAVLEILETHGWVSDSLVEKKMGIPAGRVSARRNEIEKQGAVTVNGALYHFVKNPQKITCPVTGSTVNGWALRKPESLF